MSRLALPLYFNHVPKSAGTSLNELLSRSLPRAALGVEPFVPAIELYTLDAERLDRLALVGSHFPHWAAARRLPGWSALAVLREPWARFQSLTRHLLRIRGSEPQALLPGQVEYLALLSEGRHDAALAQAQAWYPLHASLAQCFLPEPPERREADWAAAVRAVGGYDAVLVSERLDADWPQLEGIFNGSALGTAQRLNTSAEHGDQAAGPLPEACAAQFHAQFPFEQAVYAAGVQAHAATVPRLAAQAGAGTPLAREVAPRAACRIDWDAPVRCAGLSDRLRVASFGHAGRYARRVEAGVGVVEMEAPAGPRLRLEGVFWIADAAARFDVQVSVDGVPIPLFSNAVEVGCPADPSQLWAAAELPHGAGGRLRIAFDRRGAPGLREFWLLDLALRPLPAA